MSESAPEALGRKLAQAVREACLAELSALKPGNVHEYADGHGMVVADFRRSAECLAAELGRPDGSLGERVLRSVGATRAEVGCNTNLGIVLLAAPMAQTMWAPGAGSSLRKRLGRILGRIDGDDTRQVFEAIRLANPGGLGRSPRYDVAHRPEVGLLEAMGEAAPRDRIARQYVSVFADVFELGLPVFRGALAAEMPERWAAVRVYLEFLGRFPDTHVLRKHGPEVAQSVCRQGGELLRRLRGGGSPEPLLPALEAFDAELKRRGVNPGTSADLTVAVLLAHRLERLLGTRSTTARRAPTGAAA